MAACDTCQAGYRTVGNTTDIGPIDCIPCEPGFANPTAGGGVCTKCNNGKYAAMAGATACADCPKGTFTSTDNTLTITQCTVCPKGQVSAERQQRACAAAAGQPGRLAGWLVASWLTRWLTHALDYKLCWHAWLCTCCSAPAENEACALRNVHAPHMPRLCAVPRRAGLDLLQDLQRWLLPAQLRRALRVQLPEVPGEWPWLCVRRAGACTHSAALFAANSACGCGM